MPRTSESCSDAGGAHRRHRAIPAAARATAGGRTRLEPGDDCGVDRDNDGKRRRPRAGGAASTGRDGAAVRARACARRRRATAIVGMVVVIRRNGGRRSNMSTLTASGLDGHSSRPQHRQSALNLDVAGVRKLHERPPKPIARLRGSSSRQVGDRRLPTSAQGGYLGMAELSSLQSRDELRPIHRHPTLSVFRYSFKRFSDVQ